MAELLSGRSSTGGSSRELCEMNVSYINELNPLTFQELERLFESGVSHEYIGYEYTWYEEIAFRIAGFGRPGLDLLLSRIPTSDVDRLRAILAAISWPKKKTKEIHQLLDIYIGDARPMIVSEAIDTARYLGCVDFFNKILPLQHHPSPYVVGSVLRYLSRYDPLLAKPLLLKALESEDAVIIQNGIDELDDLNAIEALPRIQQLLNHTNADVREAAQSATRNLQRQLDQDIE